MDLLHTSEIPVNGALIKVVHSDDSARKKTSAPPPNALGPRKRASTLGVITELPSKDDPQQQQQTQQKPLQPRHNNMHMVEKQRIPSSGSSGSLDGLCPHVVAGQVKAFGDQVDKALFKIEDRVVVHHGDPASSTCFLRDTEYRVVSDISYLVPIEAKIPMKLAALLGGRGLYIYNGVLEAKQTIKGILANNNTIPDMLKILVLCNDEFSMMTVQLLQHLLVLHADFDPPIKLLMAIAALKDEGLMWYKKNLPQVKLVQWNSDAYDQDLIERTRDACKGDVDVVIGCLSLGAPLQRSFKCLKKGGVAFVTEEINEKVLKSLQKMAEQQDKEIRVVQRGGVDDLKALLSLVSEGHVQPAFLQDDQSMPLQINPSGMRRKARSLSSRISRGPTLQE